MDNLPFGQLSQHRKKILQNFQKLNARTAYQKFQQLVDQIYFLARQPRKAQMALIQENLQPSTKHYGLAIVLDLMILFLAINLGFKPASQMIAPWVGNLNQLPYTPVQLPKAHFAFVPGGSITKISQVKLDGLSTLAFFDLPINTDGTLNLDSSTYYNFTSEQASALFEKAHQNGTKVVVTVSQANNAQINQILNDPNAQANAIAQAIDEAKSAQIDGVNVDFEYNGTASWGEKGKYNQFIQNFAQAVHTQIPGGILTVSVPNSESNDFYDLSGIAKNSDQVLVMAYTVAVPETRDASIITPIFGDTTGQDYWSRLSNLVVGVFNQLPQQKFAMETAWYGNGNSYPLYVPKDVPASGGVAASVGNTMHTPLSEETINSLVSEVPADAQGAARQNLPYIAKALEDEGILNQNVLAYALATVQHETAGTFQPIEEIKGRMSARRLGYEGGTDYFGRGFIQLTHLRNYKVIGERIGMGDQLVQNPELASRPDVAAKVLAAFFKDNNVANLATSGNFVAARNPVNPDYWAYSIAQIAYRYLYAIA